MHMYGGHEFIFFKIYFLLKKSGNFYLLKCYFEAILGRNWDKSLKSFMYRRPILCTLRGAVDFLKFLKIAVVAPPPPQQPFFRTFNRNV